jgi:hypothetical protein
LNFQDLVGGRIKLVEIFTHAGADDLVLISTTSGIGFFDRYYSVSGEALLEVVGDRQTLKGCIVIHCDIRNVTREDEYSKWTETEVDIITEANHLVRFIFDGYAQVH